jgi:hypothetical protein
MLIIGLIWLVLCIAGCIVIMYGWRPTRHWHYLIYLVLLPAIAAVGLYDAVRTVQLNRSIKRYYNK